MTPKRGSNSVLLHPETEEFKNGTLWIAVEGFRSNINKLAISARIKSYKPETTLNTGDASTCTVADTEYFKYEITSLDI